MTGTRFERLASVVAALVLFAAATASAQTDYSPRIRSLGTGLAGIVDDPFTDAFLNPARVGDLEGRGFYAGRLPQRSLSILHPKNVGLNRWGINVLPTEGYPEAAAWPWYTSYAPYAIGLVTPISSSWKMSLSGEVAVNGYNDLSESEEVQLASAPSLDELLARDGIRANDRSLYHGVIDLAVGTGSVESQKRRYGFRGTVAYDRSTTADVDTDASVRSEVDGGENQSLYYRYSREKGEFERVSGAVSFGAFKSNTWFSQFVVGFGAGRETAAIDNFFMQEEDDDYDGNGVGMGGDSTPEYSLVRNGFASDRTYDSGRLFARLGLRWGERVRSFHRLTYYRLNGDGTAGLTGLDREFETSNESIEQRIDYAVDGETTGYVFVNAIGFADRLSDNFLFACAAEAVIRRDNYDENGDGNGTLDIDENGTSTQYESPYTQIMAYQYDHWRLSLPVSFEWTINEYVAWRFGIDFRATRTEKDARVSRDIDVLDVPELGFLPVEDGLDRVDYDTNVYFASGVTLSYKNRLGLELLSGPAPSGLDVVYVNSAALYFRF